MTDIAPTLDELLAAIDAAKLDVDRSRVKDAYTFAAEAHAGQLRMSGAPYITHPTAAAIMLTELEVDEETLIACLLHDVPEDTPRTLEDVQAAFGPVVGSIVEGVTKLSKVHYKNDMEQHQIENLRKMFLVMAQDLRVVLVKLADRLHNMQTLQWVRPEKRVRIARETLEIYAPLADRLGIWQFKWKLEDACFKHLHPLEESALREQLTEGQVEREHYIEEVRTLLAAEIAKAGMEHVEVSGRTKHLYSIFRKMELKHRSLEEVHDLFALRVVVPKVSDCYAVLGIIHDLWRPKPGRFKDYIAVPKPNGYQSLHTTVFCIGGRLTEFQIRTWEMHHDAEFGDPAHWHYAATTGTKQAAPNRDWLLRIMELQESSEDAREFIESVKLDMFEDRIFVFTPNGDVKELASGATALDFAYAIHTDIGHRTQGVKVNGLIAPLTAELHTGDVVEVLTARSSPGPKRDWLNLVKTGQAKAKIRTWFRHQHKGENVALGRTLLDRTLQQAGKDRASELSKERLASALDAFHHKELDDLLAAIGEGTLAPFQVLKKLFRPNELLTEVPSDAPAPSAASAQRIFIQGAGDIEVTPAKCCAPVPGTKIVGYITKTKSISVHRAECRALKTLDPERLIHATWGAPSQSQRFTGVVRISCAPRSGLSRDILLAISRIDVSVQSLETLKKSEKEVVLRLAVEIANLDMLGVLLATIERVPGVQEVRRERA